MNNEEIQRRAREEHAAANGHDNEVLRQTKADAAAIFNGHGALEPGELKAIRGDLKTIRRTRWAWKGWAPLGSLLVLAGEPGMGKGVVLCWMLAQLTHGNMPGDLEGEPINILWVGQEDSWEEVVLPRLVAAGADVDRCFNLKVAEGKFLDVKRDWEALTALVDEHSIRVIAFEAIVDNLGEIDDHKNKEVRRALGPLVALARQRQLLVAGTTHMTKDSKGSYRQRVLGSGGYLAVARVGWLVHRHPSEPELRVLAYGKGNLGAVPDSMVFAIEGIDVPNPVNEEIANVGRVAEDPEPYLDRSLGAEELLAGPKPDYGSREDEVRAFLKNLLVDGPVRAPDVYEKGKQRGLSKSALQSHHVSAGVRTVKKEDGWWWEAME